MLYYKGGGGYVLVVKFSGGFCPSCKIQRWDYVLVVKFVGGDYVHVYKNEQGGVVRKGFCPTLIVNRSGLSL